MSKQRTKAMAAAVASVLAGDTMAVAAQAYGVTTRGLYNALVQDGVPRPGRGRPRRTEPKPSKAGDPVAQRASRLAQAAHRGSRMSVKTELENARLILAWEAEQLSEGQMARLLDIDRVSLRKMREDAIAAGLALAEAIYKTFPPHPPRT